MNIKKRAIVFVVTGIIGAINVLMIWSCNEEEEFIVGENLIVSDSRISYTDTFSVSLSTVWLDSLATNKIDTLLIGNYEDEVFGKISCKGYWQFGLPDSKIVKKDDVFDSISIIISYSEYSYGDTLLPLTLSLHQLSESLELRESGSLYNSSEFAYHEEPIGIYTFKPRPGTKDSIEFRIDQEFGEEIFELLREESEIVEDNESFIHKYPGFVLVADTTQNASIIGFRADEDKMVMKIYSHRIEEEREDLEYEFPVINSELTFNTISPNFSKSEIEKIVERGKAYSATALNNKSYMQGGVGLMGRISFPSLQEFLLIENCELLRAELILRPDKTSYTDFELPEDLFLYHSDKYNSIGSVLTDEEGDYITSEITIDAEYNEQTYYSFNITHFLQTELADSYFDPEHAILVSFSYEEYIYSLKRLILDGDDGAAIIRIYYLHY